MYLALDRKQPVDMKRLLAKKILSYAQFISKFLAMDRFWSDFLNKITLISVMSSFVICSGSMLPSEVSVVFSK